MAANAHDDIEQALDKVRAILLRWHGEGKFGEVAVIVGQNQYEPQERPIVRHEPVKRHKGARPIARVDRF